ncbi:MAG: DUF58 domain-containing protein [Phycisphaeraceae bacterium]
MIVPGRSTVFGFAVLAIVCLGVLVDPAILWAVLALNVALLLLFATEGRRLRRAAVKIELEHSSRSQVGHATTLGYRITNRSRTPLDVHIHQPMPPRCSSENEHASTTVQAGEMVTLGVEVTPHRRGRIAFPPAHVQVRTHGDFARRQLTPDASAHLTVYPDMAQINAYEILRHNRALAQIGIHRVRRVGAGREFERLREYERDDDYRDINWKATARRREPVTNTFVHERSQNVMLCLDTGRMMGNPVGDATALDYAVDAAIMLANCCADQGDRVGLATFDDAVRRFIRPASGAAATRRVVEELVDVEAEAVFPSYAALVSALRAGHRRRSLLFLFTDLNDPQLASDLAEVLPLAGRRHVVVVVSLRDAMLETVAAGPATDAEAMHEVLAARKLSNERAARVASLRNAGMMVLEADAQHITMQVINTYLDVKMRQLV